MRSTFVRFQIVKQQTDPEKKVQIACSQAKKLEYKYFKVAIVVSDLRQIPSFSLLLWPFCGAFMLEKPADVAHYYT